MCVRTVCTHEKPVGKVGKTSLPQQASKGGREQFLLLLPRVVLP